MDLTGDLTDFFNVSYDVLCRTGTQGGVPRAEAGRIPFALSALLHDAVCSVRSLD